MTSAGNRLFRGAFACAVLTSLAGCAAHDAEEDRGASQQAVDIAKPALPDDDRLQLGLMTSLPLYWSPGSDVAAMAAGTGDTPWQRKLLEMDYDLVPLDTLSPIPGLGPDDAETDPLAGLDRLAIIQPRGLSPADNVALDKWVKDGGQLLLVLDPMLTGHYDFAFGDPRRPTDIALVPPVVARWGLDITYDENQPGLRQLESDPVPRGALPAFVAMTGKLEETGGESRCAILAEATVARCSLGKGELVLFADAAIFEEKVTAEGDATGERQPIVQFLRFVFDDEGGGDEGGK